MAGIEFQSALSTAEIVIEPGSATLAAVGPQGLIIAEMLVPHRSITHQAAFVWGLPADDSPLMSGQSARFTSIQRPEFSGQEQPDKIPEDFAAHVKFPHQLCQIPLEHGIETRRVPMSLPRGDTSSADEVVLQSLRDGGVWWDVEEQMEKRIITRKAGFLYPALRSQSSFLRAFKSDDEAAAMERSTFQTLQPVARRRIVPLLSLRSMEQQPRWRIPQRNAEGEYDHVSPPSHLDPGDDGFDFDSVTGLYAATYGPHGIEIVSLEGRYARREKQLSNVALPYSYTCTRAF